MLGIKLKKRRKKTAELGHSVLFSVYKSNFPQMPIPEENMNAFWSDLITKVPESNYFKLMQIDYSRWPPGTVTKNSICISRTIS